MKPINILKHKQIKVTQIRLELVEILDNNKHPLSTKDIERRLSQEPDRVTLYRNLKFLVDNDVIHKIEINGSVTSYTLNKTDINQGHDSEHLHFHCNICNKVVCMPQCVIKKQDLPEGFTQESCKLIVNGTCNICNSKHQ